jgi:hypothetical protein
MPRLSQLMIRTALVWLAIGSAVGGLLLLNKGLPLLPWLWTLRMTHVYLLLVGWMVQFACGVAFWILPRLDASGARGDERLAWLCYGALNAGVALAALHDPLAVAFDRASSVGAMVLRALLVLAGLLYVLSVSAFIAHAWPRVIAFRTLPRPARSVTTTADQQRP